MVSWYAFLPVFCTEKDRKGILDIPKIQSQNSALQNKKRKENNNNNKHTHKKHKTKAKENNNSNNLCSKTVC